MPIVINLDVMMARRKMNLSELSKIVGISTVNLSILKTGKARAIRFTTMHALCNALDCKPGDLLDFMDDEAYLKLFHTPPAYLNEYEDDEDEDD